MAEDPPSMNHNCKIFIPTILFSSPRKCKGELRLLLPQILMKHRVDRFRLGSTCQQQMRRSAV